MRLDFLREYQMLAEVLNYTQAARKLHITQSTLSKHIAELERETGLKLLDHSAATPTITLVGGMFLEEVTLILSAYDSAIEKCRAVQDQNRQLVLQDAPLSRPMELLYSVLRNFRAANGGITYSFNDLSKCTSVYEALEKGIADIVMDIHLGQDGDEYVERVTGLGYRCLPLLSEPLVCWLKTGNPALRSERFTFEDIANIPMLTSSGTMFNSIRLALAETFRKREAIPLFRAKPVTNIAEVSSLFLADYGDAMVVTTSGMLDDRRMTSRGDIEYRLLDDPDLISTTYLLCETENELGRTFLDFAAAEIQSL